VSKLFASHSNVHMRRYIRPPYYPLSEQLFVSRVDRELLSEGGYEPVERMPNEHELVVVVESISRSGRTHRVETAQVSTAHVTIVDPVQVTWVGCRRQFTRRHSQHLQRTESEMEMGHFFVTLDPCDPSHS